MNASPLLLHTHVFLLFFKVCMCGVCACVCPAYLCKGVFQRNLLCSAALAFLGVIGTYEYGLGRGLCFAMGGPHIPTLSMVCGGVLRGAVE